MGVIVQNFTTAEGFIIPELYIQIATIRISKSGTNSANYSCVYFSQAFKSYADMQAGRNPVVIPAYLANGEEILSALQFYEQTIHGFAYGCIKRLWTRDGYTVVDYYRSPPTPTTYIYDCSGYDIHGFNSDGWDREGYGRDGFNKDGWDREGYGRDGFNPMGWDCEGYGRDGFNIDGWDREGYGRDGFNPMGWDREGYGRDGFNAVGYNRSGMDRYGYGYNGLDADGAPRPNIDISGNPWPLYLSPSPFYTPYTLPLYYSTNVGYFSVAQKMYSTPVSTMTNMMTQWPTGIGYLSSLGRYYATAISTIRE